MLDLNFKTQMQNETPAIFETQRRRALLYEEMKLDEMCPLMCSAWTTGQESQITLAFTDKYRVMSGWGNLPHAHGASSMFGHG